MRVCDCLSVCVCVVRNFEHLSSSLQTLTESRQIGYKTGIKQEGKSL